MTPQKRFLMRPKTRRADRGITHEAFADTAGISCGYLARLETGTQDPALTTRKNPARALTVTVGELVEQGRGRP